MSATAQGARHDDRLDIRLPADLHERLRVLAERNDRSKSREIRRAITAYLEREEAA